MKALAIGLMILITIGISSIGLGATKEATGQAPQASVESLIQQGPGLIAQGEFQQVLSSISALPIQARNDIRVRCLECFANLSAWRKTNAALYEMAWQELRQKLIYAGDSEVTPLLAVLLQDKDAFVREYAAELLGYVGDKRALAALQARKADASGDVRKYAKWAHKQIADGLTPFTADLPPLRAPRVQIPIAMDKAGPIVTGKSVSFVNGTEDFKITLLGFDGDSFTKYYADVETWSDIVIEQLETELQKRGVRVVVPGGPDAHKVVIGVLNTSGSQSSGGEKKDLMEKLGQKPLVRLVDIGEYSSLDDLLKNGYEKAAGYAKNSPVDMLLHIDRIGGEVYNFNLIDPKAKVMQTASLTAEMGSFAELKARQLCTQVLADAYLNRVLRAKKKAAAAATRAASTGDLVFSITVKTAVIRYMVGASSCYGIVQAKQQKGAWYKNYAFNNVGADAERAIDAALYKAVTIILKDSAFRQALAP